MAARNDTTVTNRSRPDDFALLPGTGRVGPKADRPAEAQRGRVVEAR